jgi:hypothetical protein
VFDWLFEGDQRAYLLLGLAAAALLGLWWRDRRKGWLIGVGAVAALLGLYFLLDRLVETRREQISRKVVEMAAAVEKNDPDKLLSHVSPQFKWGGMNKDEFTKVVKDLLALAKGKTLQAWEVRFPDDKGKVTFNVTGRDSRGNTAPGRVEAVFVRDPDGQWRMQTLEVFYHTSRTPIGLSEIRQRAGW